MCTFFLHLLFFAYTSNIHSDHIPTTFNLVAKKLNFNYGAPTLHPHIQTWQKKKLPVWKHKSLITCQQKCVQSNISTDTKHEGSNFKWIFTEPWKYHQSCHSTLPYSGVLKPNSAQCQQGRMRDKKSAAQRADIDLNASGDLTSLYVQALDKRSKEKLPLIRQKPQNRSQLWMVGLWSQTVGLRRTERQKRMKKEQWAATTNTIANNSTSNHLLWEPV